MTFLAHVAAPSGWSGAAGRDDEANSDAGAAGFLARNRRSILLNRVLQAEILPRLAVARLGAAAAPASAEPAVAVTDYDIAELVRLLLGRDDDRAWGFVGQMQKNGASAASLYLGVIAAAARRLGEFWQDDHCGFTQVTIGLGRLQQVVRALSPSFQVAAVARPANAETLLLLPAPGEQHTLGLIVLSEFFRRDGWHVLGGPVSAGYDAVGIVRDNWIDVAGFSIGAGKGLDSLAACIAAVRRASRNRQLAVMAGGPLFLNHPELVARVGADTTAADAPGAVRQARGLLAMRAVAG